MVAAEYESVAELISVIDGKDRFRKHIRIENLSLTASCGLDIYPSDMMIVSDGMRNLAEIHIYLIPIRTNAYLSHETAVSRSMLLSQHFISAPLSFSIPARFPHFLQR